MENSTRARPERIGRPDTSVVSDQRAAPGLLRIGSRGSALALRQTAIVVEAIAQKDPSIVCHLEVVRTPGDESEDQGLGGFDGQGVFVRGLDTALRDGRIDIAVHSAKDMPSAEMAGLMIGAFLPREDPRDALVTSNGELLASLAPGARVGTGSPRRAALLLAVRPDLQVVPIRGNVDTRLRRVADRNLDGVVVAAAGLARLDRLAEASELLDPSQFVPAVGQGILAIQIRSEAGAISSLISALDDPVTRACASAERAVANTVGAGCQTPLGAFARVATGLLIVDAFLAAGAGGRPVRAHEEGALPDAVALGRAAGLTLMRLAGADGN